MYLFNMAGAVIAQVHAIHKSMKIVFTFATLLFAVKGFSQLNPDKFIRRDTIIINLTDTTITNSLLQSIYQGKLEARDAVSDIKIPPQQIYTWKTSADTMMVWDAKKQENVKLLVRQKIKPEQIARMKVFVEWWFISSTGKLQAIIKERELQKIVNSASGSFIGYTNFCRITETH
jgi:hypothetical protein